MNADDAKVNNNAHPVVSLLLDNLYVVRPITRKLSAVMVGLNIQGTPNQTKGTISSEYVGQYNEVTVPVEWFVIKNQSWITGGIKLLIISSGYWAQSFPLANIFA